MIDHKVYSCNLLSCTLILIGACVLGEMYLFMYTCISQFEFGVIYISNVIVLK